MIEFKGTFWRKYHGALIQASSPDKIYTLSKKEMYELIKKYKVFFLRYITDFDCTKKQEFWYVIKTEQEDLNKYKSKIRNQIKKRLKNCIVKNVKNTEVANFGYEIYRKALSSYDSKIKILTKQQFSEQILDSINDFFAVYNQDNKMIAYAQNIIENDSVNYSTIKFDPEFLNLYPSYALFYEMNKYYLNEKNYKYVNDGARSISHETNIQDFLEKKFNFRKAYCKLNIVYRWDIKILVILLYPFKNIIAKINNKVFNKISVLLKQEEIRKSYE